MRSPSHNRRKTWEGGFPTIVFMHPEKTPVGHTSPNKHRRQHANLTRHISRNGGVQTGHLDGREQPVHMGNLRLGDTYHEMPGTATRNISQNTTIVCP